MYNKIEFHSGHWNNKNSGANGLINEVTENRRVTERLHAILKKQGYLSTLFHDDVSTNQSQNLGRIVEHHNKDNDGLIVSIHFNSSGSVVNRAIGVEVLHHSQGELASELSKAISDSTGGGLLNRGAKERKDLSVLSKTNEHAVLIEVCFVNSSVDVAIYKRDFEKICQAIVGVLIKRLKKTVNDKKYHVCVGSFVSNENAKNLMRELRGKGYDAYIKE